MVVCKTHKLNVGQDITEVMSHLAGGSYACQEDRVALDAFDEFRIPVSCEEKLLGCHRLDVSADRLLVLFSDVGWTFGDYDDVGAADARMWFT